MAANQCTLDLKRPLSSSIVLLRCTDNLNFYRRMGNVYGEVGSSKITFSQAGSAKHEFVPTNLSRKDIPGNGKMQSLL